MTPLSSDRRYSEAEFTAAGADLTALDYQLIKRLLARSCTAFNSGAAERWLACFAEDAEQIVEVEKTGNHRSFSGSTGLREYFNSLMREHPAGTSRRFNNIARIAGRGNAAISFAGEIHFKPLQSGGMAPITMNICRDRIQKRGEDWKFAERRLIQEYIDFGSWADDAMTALVLGGASPPDPDLWPLGAGIVGSKPDLDYELILQASAARNYTLDYADSAGMASLFTERGVMMIIGLDHLYNGAKWHSKPMKPFFRGPKVIEEFQRASHVGRRAPERHLYHAPLIDIFGDTASSFMQTEVFLTGAGDQIRGMTGGLYQDRLRKIEGQWQFEEFIIHVEPAPEKLSDILRLAAGQYVHNVR